MDGPQFILYTQLLLAFLLGSSLTALLIAGSNAIGHRWLAREVRRHPVSRAFVENKDADEMREAA